MKKLCCQLLLLELTVTGIQEQDKGGWDANLW